MILSIKIKTDWARGGTRNKYIYALLGFVAGLAWWTNNLVIYYFIAACIFLVPILRHKIISNENLLLSAFFIIGSLPMWVYKMRHISLLKGRLIPISLSNFLPAIKNFFLQGLPIIFGARQAWSDVDIFPYATLFVYGIYGSALAYCIVKRNRQNGYRWGNLDISLFLLCVILIMFSLSKQAGGFALEPRYLLPIYSVITILLGYLISKLYDKSKVAALMITMTVIAINIYGTIKLIPELQLPFANDLRVARNNVPLIDFLKKNEIDAVYTDYWIAYRLTFETNEEVIAIPWGENRTDRYPKYRDLIKNRKKLAYVIQGAAALKFSDFLRKSNISYETDKLGNYEVFFNFRPVSITNFRNPLPVFGWDCFSSDNP